MFRFLVSLMLAFLVVEGTVSSVALPLDPLQAMEKISRTFDPRNDWYQGQGPGPSYLDLKRATIIQESETLILLEIYVYGKIPETPGDPWFVYEWLVDSDRNPLTGVSFQGIGLEWELLVFWTSIDLGFGVGWSYWLRNITAVATYTPLPVDDFEVFTNRRLGVVRAHIDTRMMTPEGPAAFDWIAAAGGAYSVDVAPNDTHMTFVIKNH